MLASILTLTAIATSMIHTRMDNLFTTMTSSFPTVTIIALMSFFIMKVVTVIRAGKWFVTTHTIYLLKRNR